MVPPVGEIPRRRRTVEETRSVLLAAGVRLVLASLHADEAIGGGPLAHIRVQDVVREASQHEGSTLTTGALYNIWPTQREYQVDLMFHVLRAGAYPSAEPVLRLAGELFARRLPPEEIGERLSDESFRLEVGSPFTRAAISFVALAGVPSIREALRAGHDALLKDGRVLYSQILVYSGLRVRPPYTLDQLITVIAALSGGLESQFAIVPELFELPKDSRSLVATASLAIFREFCEPAPKTHQDVRSQRLIGEPAPSGSLNPRRKRRPARQEPRQA